MLNIFLPELDKRWSICRWSHSVALFGSKTRFDYEWRAKKLIKAEEFPIKIDILCGLNGWIEAEVKSIKKNDAGIYMGYCPTIIKHTD